MDIVLIAPPWPLFNRPSIQIAALKAYLVRNLPKEVRIKNLHPYLDVASAIGFSDYHRVSQSGWASEAVFSKVLFPELDGQQRLFLSSLSSRSRNGFRPDFHRICELSQKALEGALARHDFSATRLVGITVCLNQLTSGLYTAKFLKRRYPDLTVVMGGASVSGQVGEGILSAFPWVDHVVDGEGEIPLLSLCRQVFGLQGGGSSKAVSGRDEAPFVCKEQVEDVNGLPVPDFDDYFVELSKVKGAGGIGVVLPVEASRGCWWGRCSFCNLNLQWKGYRFKKPARVAAEVDFLSKRYRCIDFAFMDNCLPRREAAEIFGALCSHGRDYSIFGEIRAVHTKDELARMKSGGLTTIQAGIEALSSRLLERLGKGTAVVQNLFLMKCCAELGMELQSNLITCFPGSTREEVDETLENLDYAWPFAPLKPVRFWLGMASPVHEDYRKYGIRRIMPSKNYDCLFPPEVLEAFVPLILDYAGDRTAQARLWKPVEKKLDYFGRRRKELGLRGSALTYRDGREFLKVRQVLPDGRVLTHRLAGPSRQLYLAASSPLSIEALCDKAPGISKKDIERFIDEMCLKRLMFRDGTLVLSLACRQGS